MVEYTSDICRVNSSNLFRPSKASVAKLVNALNLEFSLKRIRVQVSSEVINYLSSSLIGKAIHC